MDLYVTYHTGLQIGSVPITVDVDEVTSDVIAEIKKQLIQTLNDGGIICKNLTLLNIIKLPIK